MIVNKTLSGIDFEIETLGPVRDSIIHFNPFLLFSGESNTGKSYTAIAVYYLFFMLNNEKILSELTRRLFNIEKIEASLKTGKEVEEELPKHLLHELEKLYNSNIDRFMAYMLGYDDFSCSVKLRLTAPLPAGIKMYIIRPRGEEWSINAELRIGLTIGSSLGVLGIKGEMVRRTVNDTEIKIGHLLGDYCKSLFFKRMDHSAFFLPPARGAFSGLAPSMWKEISGIGMYNEFLKGIDRVRFSMIDRNEESEENRHFINPLLTGLLKGKINLERDKELFTLNGTGERIPLTAVSSSVKELFPLYLLLKRVPSEKLSICIEEPEAHLHPELQRNAALLLSYIVNKGGFIQVTTHSDFFVNQVNNLLKLHFLGRKDPRRFKTALKKTGIQAEFVLNPENLGAYYFERAKGGFCARVLDISEKGMPLESFKKAYELSVEETRNLREALLADEH